MRNDFSLESSKNREGRNRVYPSNALGDFVLIRKTKIGFFRLVMKSRKREKSGNKGEFSLDVRRILQIQKQF